MSVDIFLLQLADVIKLILLFYQSFAALQNKPGPFIDIITYGFVDAPAAGIAEHFPWLMLYI